MAAPEWLEHCTYGTVEASRRVWILGEADDYIVGVFSTEEAAKEVLERLRDSDYWWIDDFPLDPLVSAPQTATAR